MSESLGKALPDELFARLSGPDGADWSNQAVLIATLDELGRPHPALLSLDELYAPARDRLRLATYADSRTTAHLRARGSVTLCLIGPGRVYYVKARARELPPGPRELHGNVGFEADVEDVRLDFASENAEGATAVTSGITFERARPAPPLRDLLRSA